MLGYAMASPPLGVFKRVYPSKGAGNMIALNAGFATLTGFHPCQLL
jgi:hypothetical protein